MKKSVNKSNGYEAREFFSFPKNGTIPASFKISTATGTGNGTFICWSPGLKSYFFSDFGNGTKVYSQRPDGQMALVFTCSGVIHGMHWSKLLSALVVMTTTHIYTSANGVDFTSRTVPASYALSNLVSTFVDASTYLLVFGIEGSTGYMYKTTDGITWTRSASGTGSSTNVVAGAIGDTVGYSNNAGSGTDTIRYTTNGTTYATATGTGTTSSDNFFPPTPLRPVFLHDYNGTVIEGSTDGITYSSYSIGTQNTRSAGSPAWFGGVCRGYGNVGHVHEYLTMGTTATGFVITGTFPNETFASLEGEYATYSNRTKAHRVGKWLGIGQFEVWLIGGGAPNASTSVGGTAGFLTIHRMTVTEKWRYCVYVYLGAAAIVDTVTGEFLAYASMLTSTSTSAQVNMAGFGSECYPGLGSTGTHGAACGPSNGFASFMAVTLSGGSLTPSQTSATTPPDFWCPWDFAGNPSGTGYPGTAGSTVATIGLLGGPTATTVTGSFGSGGCNSSAALTTVGGESLAIIYSR